jgi:uncharacterized protein (DUF1330 family)
MTAYCIGYAQNLNMDKLKEYGQHAANALKKHQGSLVSRSANPTILDGDTASELTLILSFPSEELALAWRHDPELAAVHELREASGDWRIELLSA